MAKGGMKRTAYFQGDPTYDAVWAKWRKEEKAAKQERRAMIPFRVMGIVRLFIKKAGYRLNSDIEIIDKKTGVKYISTTVNKEP